MLAVLQALQALPSQAGARLRRSAVSAGLFLSAAIFLLAAAGLAFAALYLWLSTLWPAYIAMIVTACAPATIALILAFCASPRRRSAAV